MQRIDDWQPIETAPKDGSWFWAFYPRQHHYEDQFAVARWRETPGNPPMFWDSAEHRDDEQPTHWMSLPKLPFGAGCNPGQSRQEPGNAPVHRHSLFVSEENRGAIKDTLWMCETISRAETVLDYIDDALGIEDGDPLREAIL